MTADPRALDDVVEAMARVLFRATFAPDEDEALVAERWNEWPADVRRARRQATALLPFLTAAERRGAEGMRAKVVTWLRDHECSGILFEEPFDEAADLIRTLALPGEGVD